jgi:hypothetical protein
LKHRGAIAEGQVKIVSYGRHDRRQPGAEADCLPSETTAETPEPVGNMEHVTTHPLVSLDWPDVLTWFVAHQGEDVDVTVETRPGGVLLDGEVPLRVHDCRPGRMPANLRLDLPGGLRFFLNERSVRDCIEERATGELTVLVGGVALMLRPL